MQRLAATKIDKALRGNNATETADGETPEDSTKEPQTAKFEVVNGKRRKSGTGCISKLGVMSIPKPRKSANTYSLK